jgi:hypothetical protein
MIPFPLALIQAIGVKIDGTREGNGALRLPTFLLLVESAPKPRPLLAKHRKLNALWVLWRAMFEPNILISALCRGGPSIGHR